MNLIDFVKLLPADWVLAPIYRKGAKMRSGKEATGKNPLEVAFDKDLGPADVALQLEKNENLGAVGLFTGMRGRGIVILDVDENLAALKRKWGDSLNGAPVITSTKKNAAKFIFRVPEELWNQVDGFGHGEDHKDGYEVLWGSQGLIYGAYAGSSCGKYPVGDYSFNGDPETVPAAPEWLLAEMKAAKTPETFIKNRTALDLSDRTEDEVAVIITECLDVIENRGSGQRDHWVKVGMAIHSVLPNDLGLTLWSAWSAKDVEFSDEWERGNPCEQVWASFKPGRIGLGSLIYMADRVDPKRSRFTNNSKQILEAAETTLKTREQLPGWDEVYKRADAIFSNDEQSVGERRYELLKLAREAGIGFKPVQELTEMYLAHKEKLMGTTKKRSAEDRWDNPESASYYVPGVLCAGVWLMSGRGGSGKTNAAWAFASHFLSGTPLDSEDGSLKWEKGRVLLLTGDQPDSVTDDQIRTHLTREQCKGLTVENNFNINDYPSFLMYARQHRPKLVIIDSLRSTHRGTGVSENDSEFALPLRWYEQMMGRSGMFDPMMILVIHHSGKAAGGARGTSALGDMTSFAMDFTIPNEKSELNSADTRVITFTKHRFGAKDHQMLATLEQDSTVKLRYLGASYATTAATIQDRIRMKFMQKPDKGWSINELSEDKVINGGKDACKKAVQRLVRMGQAEEKGVGAPGQGRPQKLWGASGVVSGWISGAQNPQLSVSTVPESTKSTGTTGDSAGTQPVPKVDSVPPNEVWD